MNVSTFARILWLTAGLALLIGLGSDPRFGLLPHPRELPRFDNRTGVSWIDGDFVSIENSWPHERALFPSRLPAVSSEPRGEIAQGRAESAWFKANRRVVRVGVAGYPRHPNIHLWAEFRDAAGAITRIECDLTDPGEHWDVWEIRRPLDATAVRIVGEDRGSGHADWLAFSHPFRAWPSAIVTVSHVLQLLGTTALVLALAHGVRSLLARRRTNPCRLGDASSPDAPEALHSSPMRAEAAVAPVAARLPVLAWLIFALAVAAVLIGPWHFPFERPQPLPRLAAESGNARPGSPAPTTFAPGAVYTSTDTREAPAGIETHGSWLGSDAFQGTYDSGWFAVAPETTLAVAGYPTLAGNQLELEVRRRNGAVERLSFSDPNPGEMWQRWRPPLPADAVALRILATDATSQAAGWLGVSIPFTAPPRLAPQLWSTVQLVATTCLALTLLYGPGLLWFGAQPRPLHAFALAILPGPLLVAGLGFVVWALGGVFAPATIARVGVGVLLAFIGWSAGLRRRGPSLPRETRLLVAACALLVGFAVAKANVSFGPAGELFRNTISRTLAVGGHSDSRISYHVVQVMARHLAPFGDRAENYFSPWNFASRGPLSGAVATPVVLAVGAEVSLDHPNQGWRPFDRQGFATYRIVLIVLASLAAWAVFAVIASVASAAWAMLAAITLLFAPFFVHELYFSWPKLITAALVLLAFLLVHRGRPLFGGIALGLGYLFHPLAALSAPFVALWALTRPAATFPRRLVAPALFCTGVLLLVIPWQIVGHLRASEGGSQDVFLSYFRNADNAAATPATWWRSRWHNVANTFIPGYLLAGDPTHESVNSYYGPSDAWVRRSFLYWNTLPFALGLPAFALVAAGLASACRRAFAVTAIVFLAPTLLLVVYWGAASTGLMRHCGHVLFLSAIALATWGLATTRTAWRERLVAAFLHPACFAWRAGEILLVAFGTTLLHQRPDLRTLFGWNDLLSLVLAGTCLGGAVILLAKTAGSIRSQFSTANSRFHT